MANLLTKIFLATSVLLLVAIVSLQGMRSRQPTVEIPKYSPPVAMADPLERVTVGSPDGKASLTMKTEKASDSSLYTFYFAGKDDVEKEIYKKSVPSANKISIPFNTFSPDNKFLFLKEEGSGNVDYFVLPTNGEPFKQDMPVADITAPFLAKYGDKYTIAEVTGWGGLTLVVVNTEKKAGGRGPSFWFDASNMSFIQLSSRF